MAKKNSKKVVKAPKIEEIKTDEVLVTEEVVEKTEIVETKPFKNKVDSKNTKDNSKDKTNNKKTKPKKEKKPFSLIKKCKETFSELKKVSWPSFKTVCKSTGVVIVVVIVFTLVLFGIDRGLAALYNLIPR